MIKVTRFLSQDDEADLLSADDIIQIINDNRARVRTLSGAMLTVCGMVLSSSLVVLFFGLSNTKVKIPPAVATGFVA